MRGGEGGWEGEERGRWRQDRVDDSLWNPRGEGGERGLKRERERDEGGGDREEEEGNQEGKGGGEDGNDSPGSIKMLALGRPLNLTAHSASESNHENTHQIAKREVSLVIPDPLETHQGGALGGS